MTEQEQLRETLDEVKVEHTKAIATKRKALVDHRRLMAALEATERSIRAQQRRHA